MPNIDRFLSHRSIRDYEDRPVDIEIIRSLIAAAQSAATSSNLQQWSVVSVQDPDRRNRIAKLCGDQQQIRDAAWYFAFIADHHRIKSAAEELGENPSGLDFLEFYTMAVIDAALAAERFVCAAESLGLGTCYIGGLRNDPEGVKQLLNLPEGTFGIFGLCLGWPKEDSTAPIKPRLSQDCVWFEETYVPQPDVEEYNLRIKDFYISQKMKGDVTWSMRSAKRVGETQLHGREVLKGWVEQQGFIRR